ncbi:hypothetical protein Tco_0840509 [Tanacetum coccineum]|uniref:Uncharacterized protein n=1 Tax=Tanacetum coccineum TaxID=301880 RepID=A0ABQ5AWA1_9ASTR
MVVINAILESDLKQHPQHLCSFSDECPSSRDLFQRRRTSRYQRSFSEENDKSLSKADTYCEGRCVGGYAVPPDDLLKRLDKKLDQLGVGTRISKGGPESVPDSVGLAWLGC